jgi:hypothetical protein
VDISQLQCKLLTSRTVEQRKAVGPKIHISCKALDIEPWKKNGDMLPQDAKEHVMHLLLVQVRLDTTERVVCIIPWLPHQGINSSSAWVEQSCPQFTSGMKA